MIRVLYLRHTCISRGPGTPPVRASHASAVHCRIYQSVATIVAERRAFHVSLNTLEGYAYTMNTPKTVSVISGQIGQQTDEFGLFSDMLEPSVRYASPSPVSVDVASTSTGAATETDPLASLRPPKRYTRVGFNEFLD